MKPEYNERNVLHEDGSVKISSSQILNIRLCAITLPWCTFNNPECSKVEGGLVWVVC